MGDTNQAIESDPRKTVRVPYPARVDFAGERFTIHEFTTNLSEGGIFLPTDASVEPGTRGTLTFRISQWDRPFTVEAEVVRTVAPGEETFGRESGLGIRFLDLSDTDRERLQRLVDGVRDGSVVQAIRRSIREEGKGLDYELHRRPIDQKLILATFASAEETNALIRDGHPAVINRLLLNPRMRVPHVRAILRNPRLTYPMLLEIKKQREWMADEEVRWAYSHHPNAPLQDVLALLPQFSKARLQRMALERHLRSAIREKVKELIKRKA